MAKHKSRATRLSEALAKVEEAKTDVEELRDEIENWKSGMEGTNLENTAKYTALEECYDNLDEIVSNLEISTETEVEFPGMY